MHPPAPLRPQVIRKVVRRGINSEERREGEGNASVVSGDSGVATGGADDASSTATATTGAPEGKSKRRGKRSRQGHRAEKSGKTEVGL